MTDVPAAKDLSTKTRDDEDDGSSKRPVSINRVIASWRAAEPCFSALVVVGDGRKGWRRWGKAGEVLRQSKRRPAGSVESMSEIFARFHHSPRDYRQFGKGHVLLLPAEAGTGVIAGGPVRSVPKPAESRTSAQRATQQQPHQLSRLPTGTQKPAHRAQQIAALRGKAVDEL